MTKYLTATQIYVTGNDTPVEIEDTTTYSGGSAAKSQILMRKDVHVKASDGTEMYIPFHAIVMAVFTPSTETVEDPIDAFCSETGESGESGET